MSAQLQWLGLVVALGAGAAGCVGNGTPPSKGSFGSAPTSSNGSSGMSGTLAAAAGSQANRSSSGNAGSSSTAAGGPAAGAGAGQGSAMSGPGGAGMASGGQGAAGAMANAGSNASAGSGAAGSAAAPLVAGDKSSHFPLVDGSSWVYHHTKPNTAPWDETDTVHSASYMGKPAVIFEDQEDAQGVQTHSTLLADGTGVYRAYKELTIKNQTVLTVSYDPAFLRFDEAWTMKGQTITLTDKWTQNCVLGGTAAANCTTGMSTPGSTTHEFTVIDSAAMLTVPAGSFDTVEIQRVDPATKETKLFWFAAGVGKVREEDVGTMAIEELTSYQIP